MKSWFPLLLALGVLLSAEADAQSRAARRAKRALEGFQDVDASLLGEQAFSVHIGTKNVGAATLSIARRKDPDGYEVLLDVATMLEERIFLLREKTRLDPALGILQVEGERTGYAGQKVSWKVFRPGKSWVATCQLPSREPIMQMSDHPGPLYSPLVSSLLFAQRVDLRRPTVYAFPQLLLPTEGDAIAGRKEATVSSVSIRVGRRALYDHRENDVLAHRLEANLGVDGELYILVDTKGRLLSWSMRAPGYSLRIRFVAGEGKALDQDLPLPRLEGPKGAVAIWLKVGAGLADPDLLDHVVDWKALRDQRGAPATVAEFTANWKREQRARPFEEDAETRFRLQLARLEEWVFAEGAEVGAPGQSKFSLRKTGEGWRITRVPTD